MKRIISLSATISSLAAASLLTSCDALWGTASVDIDPGYYSAGIYNDWYPTLSGAPLISPIYWGNQIYPGPGSALPPPQRPNAAWRPGANRPVGNSRPNAVPSTPSVPGQGRPTIAIPDHPINLNGSNPGPALPPWGNSR